METIEYTPNGVCSKKIIIDIENNIIKKIKVIGGCPGNLAGISKLVQGMKLEEVAKRLNGVTCGPKSTSCPDQLARAINQILNK